MEDFTIKSICGTSSVLSVFKVLGMLVTIIKIVIPILLIVVSMKSLIKSLTSDNMDLKGETKKFITKFVIAAFIFFIPSIVLGIADFINGDTIGYFKSCTVCLNNLKECDIKIEEAKEKEYIIALSKEEEYLSDREKRILMEEEAKKKSLEESEKTKKEALISEEYGRGCTSFVSASSYDETKAKQIINNGLDLIGTKYVYGETDCSWFVSKVASKFVDRNTAAGLANNTKDKCVELSDVRPGDIFFTSRYNSSYECTGCSDTGRCNRFNCIMHTGIVYEVKDGKVTLLLHETPDKAQISKSSYAYAPKNGSSWLIMITRPYAS